MDDVVILETQDLHIISETQETLVKKSKLFLGTPTHQSRRYLAAQRSLKQTVEYWRATLQ
jgi:hypothetical protein